MRTLFGINMSQGRLEEGTTGDCKYPAVTVHSSWYTLKKNCPVLGGRGAPSFDFSYYEI